MFNLAMALFWLIAGGAILFWQRTHPESGALMIGGSRVSFGWFAFVLVLYNLARWWSIRSGAKGRNSPAAGQQRRPPVRRAPDEPEARPDPNFDFTTKKPPD